MKFLAIVAIFAAAVYAKDKTRIITVSVPARAAATEYVPFLNCRYLC
jgi:hypothetical protein